mgnify:CR=1 FL=1
MYSKDYYLKHREELIERNTIYYYKIKDNPNFIKRKKNYDKLFLILNRLPTFISKLYFSLTEITRTINGLLYKI